MKLSFLADECLPELIIVLLKQWGYSLRKVREIGLQGAKDPQIFEVIQEKNRSLLTTDKDFGDIRTYIPSTHPGIIILRLSRSDILDKMIRIHSLH